MTRNTVRGNDLAKIHMAKKDLAMTDDSYRALLKRLTGFESASKLSLYERSKVLNEFKRLGWTPKTKTARTVTYTRPTSRKLVAQWLELHKQGKVRDKRNAALLAWAGKTTGRDDLKSLDWLEAADAHKCIEGLKKWLDREVKADEP